MPRRKKAVKVSPRDANHESLQSKYADAGRTQLQRFEINAVLNLYKSGYIHTKATAEKQIRNALAPTSNPKRQHQKFLQTLANYVSKPPQMQARRRDKLRERGDALVREVEDRTFVNRVEQRDGGKPFSTIDIHLNTKPAFPNMPDLEDRATTRLEENFEHGEPHRDVQFHRLVEKLQPRLERQLQEQLNAKQSMKIQIGADFQLYKTYVNDNGDLVYEQSNNKVSSKVVSLTRSNLSDTVQNLLGVVGNGIEDALTEGSGWKIRRIASVFIKVHKTRIARASSYIPTPPPYNNARCGLVNIQNDDQECFRWCMKYHQSPQKKHDDRVSVLKKLEDGYDYTGVNYPATFEDIKRFEDNNAIAVFVYYINDLQEIVKERNGNPQYRDNPVYLLRVEEGDNAHYVYVKHISRLLNKSTQTGDKDKKFCPYCEKLYAEEKWERHLKVCYNENFEERVAQLPPPNSFMTFKNFKNKLARPFIVYADCEATLRKLSRVKGNTEFLNQHVVNSCCYYFVCTFDSSRNTLRTFFGKDCLRDMLRELMGLAEQCVEELKRNTAMRLTKEDKLAYEQATLCHICHEPFGESKAHKKVRDHDHITGQFRGAAHNCCNVNYFANRYVPIVFHNLRGYDSHLIIKEAWRLHQGEISVIPNSTEKFMSFKVGYLRFIDSFQFLATSLGTLAENLKSPSGDAFEHFHAMRREYPDHYELLCQKGHYPYEWFDDEAKFVYQGLPPIDCFYSQLSQKGISAEEYAHALKVYESMGFKTFKDYHEAYLKTDVLLLADVFENFRRTCITNYELDPANYLTAPSLAWDAMLYKTGAKLEQISDYEIFSMVEEQKRGGLCFVGARRYAKANNRYLDDFNPEEEESYIMYWDMNNLYGCAMVDYLPYGGHKIEEDIDLERVLRQSDDAPTGYLLRVDLRFPEAVHEKLRQFPPAPENTAPKAEWLTDYQRQLAESANVKPSAKQQKLIPHFYDHERYVIDYRNLKYIVGLGVEISKVHTIVSYQQSRWLKPYIDFNTDMRKNAKNDFEKDFFKLMNNSVFGKTMENVRNRMQMHLTTDDDNAEKWFSKPTFKNCNSVFGIYMIEMYKEEVVLDKPIYVGTTILDLSKLLMMKFHYDVIEKRFNGSSLLLYSDTDSLVYQIMTSDVYEWVKENRNIFDLSDSVRADMKDNTNKKKLGMMKDEMNTLPISTFISLNPKCYSFTYEAKVDEQRLEKNVKKLKGVSKATVKHQITHEDYNTCLGTGQSIKRKVVGIRSFRHELYTIRQEKVALTAWYDKMELRDNIHCVPFGYGG